VELNIIVSVPGQSEIRTGRINGLFFPNGLTLFEVLCRIADKMESGEGGGATSLYWYDIQKDKKMVVKKLPRDYVSY
jgi:hypothetical protein